MGHGWEQKWSIKSSALYGSLIGFALTALHQIHHAISNDIPEDVYTHVFGEFLIAGVGSAILLVAVSALSNWLQERR